MANSAASKKRNRRMIIMALALIGALTVGYNIYSLGTKLSRAVKHTVENHSWIPSVETR